VTLPSVEDSLSNGFTIAMNSNPRRRWKGSLILRHSGDLLTGEISPHLRTHLFEKDQRDSELDTLHCNSSHQISLCLGRRQYWFDLSSRASVFSLEDEI